MNKINIEWDVYPVSGVVAGSDERVKSIEGWEEYFVTDYGRVLSSKRLGSKRSNYDCLLELKQNLYGGGKIKYYGVSLSHHCKKESLRTHILVAKEFVKNSDTILYTVVNHLVHQHNNYYKNLEWTDQEGNCNHGKNTLYHSLVTPSGDNITIKGLKKFCRENCINVSHLYNRGKTKGWIYKGRVDQQEAVDATLDSFFV